MMLSRLIFHNPDFMKYIRLLYELHVALKEGWDESAEGEALRDRMDEPGGRLSGEAVAAAQGISADFYSLTDEPTSEGLPITADALADVEAALQARKSRDFQKALDRLRRNADCIPPARLAYLRGTIWMEAGDHLIAAAFLQRARDLEPQNANYQYIAMHARWMAAPSSVIEEAVAILLNTQKHPPRLVLKAADILNQQIRSLPPGQYYGELKSVIPNLETSKFEFETSGEAENDPSLLDGANGFIDYVTKTAA
jgi:tetratricopeptide (TPR) repeat protein